MPHNAGPTFTNSLGMTFVLIPKGVFTMGSPASEQGRESDETQHEATLTKPFYLQTTEVTQGQWQAIMGANPSYFKDCGADCPVEQVSWNDCQEFIRRLNQQEGGNTYRLPTEAEWEYACRAGSTTAFANGGITETGCGWDPNLASIGWYCGHSGKKTHPVAQKTPNAWGLYDMHGNVWEWCEDRYGDYPYGSVTDPEGTSSGGDRVLRGGSWFVPAGYCRSAVRGAYSPDCRDNYFGFRVARAF
jgi:formylglycine-generating enzyme required for sulfatase activity